MWLQGEIMPTINVAVDGRPIGHVGGAVGGDLVVPDTAAPLPVRLRAGRHTLTISRGGLTLAPGDGGSSQLIGAFLTPAGAGEQQAVDEVPVARWRSLCGQRYVWIEAVPVRARRLDRPSRRDRARGSAASAHRAGRRSR